MCISSLAKEEAGVATLLNAILEADDSRAAAAATVASGSRAGVVEQLEALVVAGPCVRQCVCVCVSVCKCV